ncbi:Protein NRT1/ PTR FAMILY 2.9 [Hordeum vulgare]|nr:Protein NRT1/ PTR FAMILY 2.9 [Hordeum vulgare]
MLFYMLVYLTMVYHMPSINATTLLNVFSHTRNLAIVFDTYVATPTSTATLPSPSRASYGIRPCNLSFGANQFTLCIVDSRDYIVNFFNWYCFTFNVDTTLMDTIITYLQSNLPLN